MLIEYCSYTVYLTKVLHWLDIHSQIPAPQRAYCTRMLALSEGWNVCVRCSDRDNYHKVAYKVITHNLND